MQWNPGNTNEMTPVQSTPPASSSGMKRSNMTSTPGTAHVEEQVVQGPMQNHSDFLEGRGDITDPSMDKALQVTLTMSMTLPLSH